MAVKISLGPIPYFWSAERVLAFYEEVAHWPVDIVYLGETVCAKRRGLGIDDWLAVAARLRESGKEVVLSTLALLEAGSELSALERICRNGRYPVEANDMAAVHLAAGKAPFVAGPHINTYNSETLALLAEAGAYRWVLPVELPATTLQDLQHQCTEDVQTEVVVFGRLPLAFSARCFTARAHNLPKDQCEFRCKDYPDGLALRTQEDQLLFTVNGVHLQSGLPCNLVGSVPELSELKVDVLRVLPMDQGTGTAVRAFRDAITGETDATEGMDVLALLSPDGWCNGYWYAEPGMDWRSLGQV